jgi:phosphate transport system substrate-binding protein
MQKQKLFAALSLLVAIVMLAAASGTAVTAKPNLQGTAMATEAANIPGSGLITGPMNGEAQKLTGSGATFPLPLYQEWAKEYRTLTGVEINYAGGGSGQGVNDITAQAVDFAGSDSFMKDEELAKAKGGEIVHVATTIGAIVPIYNIPELKDKEALKLSGENIAEIYMGNITKWNDPKLVADNPDLADVDQDIAPVYRSDGSGTTANFTAYLSLVNQTWAEQIKSGKTVNWPAGRGAPGNPGVANEVSQTEYSIGYVELAFAKDHQAAQVKTANGKFVPASTEQISAAVEGVEVPADLRLSLIGKSNPDAYPIVTWTWIVVYTNQTDAAKATALVRFLWWATHDGQKWAANLGYAPLPEDVIKLNEAQLAKIIADGKAVLPADMMTGMAATPAK